MSITENTDYIEVVSDDDEPFFRKRSLSASPSPVQSKRFCFEEAEPVLPYDVIVHIMSFLSSWRDMMAFGLVNKSCLSVLRNFEQQALLFETSEGREGSKKAWITRYFGRTTYQRWNPLKPKMISIICPRLPDSRDRDVSALRGLSSGDISARGINPMRGRMMNFFLDSDEVSKSPALIEYCLSKGNLHLAMGSVQTACETMVAYGDPSLCVKLGLLIKSGDLSFAEVPTYDPKQHTKDCLISLAIYTGHTSTALLKLAKTISRDPLFVWNSFVPTLAIPYLAEAGELSHVPLRTRVPWSELDLPKPIDRYSRKTQLALLRLTKDCDDGELIARLLLTSKVAADVAEAHDIEALICAIGKSWEPSVQKKFLTKTRLERLMKASGCALNNDAANILIKHLAPTYQIPNRISDGWDGNVNPDFLIYKISHMTSPTRGKAIIDFLRKFLKKPGTKKVVRTVYSRLTPETRHDIIKADPIIDIIMG